MQEYPIQRDALPRFRTPKLNVAYRGDPADRREIELAFESIVRDMLRQEMGNAKPSEKASVRENKGATT